MIQYFSMKSKRRETILTKNNSIIVACLLFTLYCLGCQKQYQNDGNVVYRLKWLLNVGAAGSLYANANGFFMLKV
ncbi:MAG: hypothetical protein OMM_11320 [Candidatus Magnetoglobus multicellularis str. Araruama]|uniref:Uncharacterized protein n=1 Tax=Candidatus Magnetoglobus multicellularis str. Araruama TaxID=890399 RepID=A0A1V1NYQ5_9BACT|nr:MAG: hypothetical protein OMM_11320 [Candidatus Magnetoglobus multicellularis str. Araruama]